MCAQNDGRVTAAVALSLICIGAISSCCCGRSIWFNDQDIPFFAFPSLVGSGLPPGFRAVLRWYFQLLRCPEGDSLRRSNYGGADRLRIWKKTQWQVSPQSLSACNGKLGNATIGRFRHSRTHWHMPIPCRRGSIFAQPEGALQGPIWARRRSELGETANLVRKHFEKCDAVSNPHATAISIMGMSVNLTICLARSSLRPA